MSIDDDFDFGFSAVSEEELKALEKKLGNIPVHTGY